MIVTAWPAIVAVAVRSLVTGFAAAVYVIDVPPVPDAVLSVSHEALELVDQPHAAAFGVSPIDPDPPPATTDADVGETAYVHAAACVIVTD